MVAAALLLLQAFHTYIGNLAEESVTIAWGRAHTYGNLIGRDSESYGSALVRVGNRTEETRRNWVRLDDLEPDTMYPYEIVLNGKSVAKGTLRTWPEKANRLAFFVIGDYGNGSNGQRRVAAAMAKEFARLAQSENPVRFVITTGDNIYSDVTIGGYSRRSGSEDWHWEDKFFEPYRDVIRHIPFYPSPGNHDGNSSESRADLAVYFDNFFFPDNKPHRWYSFDFGDLAQFFSLDTSNNTEQGRLAPVYLKDSEQFRWMSEEIPKSKAPWKIPYFHHTVFNAGPRHPPDLKALSHFHELFQRAGVKVVFSGHEHNFQFSAVSQATGGIRYVVTGAGGELRTGNVRRRMAANHIEGWAAQRHFLLVEIDGPRMKITPLSFDEMRVLDPAGKPAKIPVEVGL
jgi:hypothetical protein